MVHAVKQQEGECCSLIFQVSDKNFTHKNYDVILEKFRWKIDFTTSGQKSDYNLSKILIKGFSPSNIPI